MITSLSRCSRFNVDRVQCSSHADNKVPDTRGLSLAYCYTRQYAEGTANELGGLVVADAEAPLTLESALLESDFMGATGTAFLLRDATGRVIDCNDRAERLFQSSREDLMSDDPLRVTWNPVHEDGTPFTLDELPAVAAIRTGDPIYGVIQGIEVPSGEQLWFTVNAYPIVRNGVTRGVLIAYIDATERVRRGHVVAMLLDLHRLDSEAISEGAALRHLCHALVASGQFALVWVGIARDQPEGRVDIVESAGAQGYVSEGMVSWSISEPTGRGPVGTAFRTSSTVTISDLLAVAQMSPWRERVVRHGLRSSVTIPFSPGGERAVLAVYSRHRNAFDELTVSGLENIARATERVIAHGAAALELAAALSGTLSALARITEARDPYTAGHQSRVGTLAATIAQRLGLEPTLIERVRDAGAVHDVGKVALSSEILIKPSRLTDLEYRMIKRHALIGYEILSKASLPWPIPEVALQHHERLNGSGYPNSLVGDDIILPARIVAVADVVEAMSNHRPYRAALGLEQALDQVASNAGTLYDAEVVRHCLKVFEDGFEFTTDQPESIFNV